MGDTHYETLLGQVLKSTKEHGVQVVLDHLKILEPDQKNQIKKQRYIIKSVCTSFDVDSKVFQKRYVKNRAKDARTACIYLLYEHLSLSHRDIALIFSRQSHGFVTEAIKEHKEMDEKIPNHRDYLIRFDIAQKKIQEFTQH